MEDPSVSFIINQNTLGRHSSGLTRLSHIIADIGILHRPRTIDNRVTLHCRTSTPEQEFELALTDFFTGALDLMTNVLV